MHLFQVLFLDFEYLVIRDIYLKRKPYKVSIEKRNKLSSKMLFFTSASTIYTCQSKVRHKSLRFLPDALIIQIGGQRSILHPGPCSKTLQISAKLQNILDYFQSCTVGQMVVRRRRIVLWAEPGYRLRPDSCAQSCQLFSQLFMYNLNGRN